MWQIASAAWRMESAPPFLFTGVTSKYLVQLSVATKDIAAGSSEVLVLVNIKSNAMVGLLAFALDVVLASDNLYGPSLDLVATQ